jgi:single-strand selective monofunctional uracil DNA glycosylase
VTSIAGELEACANQLSEEVARLKFGPPVAFVYNPLDYARAVHRAYLRAFGAGSRRVIFVGMNPGPFGMAQTGVPFGEINAVQNWMKIGGPVARPAREHPRRPVEGFACRRSEVSGRRLWGLFADRFGSAEKFFNEHFVVNYCPLAFFDEDGRNLTPDGLGAGQTARLFESCDRHLRRVVTILQPEWVIGVGDFAERRARTALEGLDRGVRIGRILHPSPASPAANQDWPGKVVAQLDHLGVW